MKSAVKKSVAFILAAVMVFSLAVTSFAMQQWTDNEDGKTRTISGYDADGNENGVLSLKATIPVGQASLVFTGVADNAFNAELSTLSNKERTFLNSVTEITVDDGIKNIGEYSFANLPQLKKVTFSGDAVLAANAFAGCAALENVIFEKAAVIGENAFNGCAALKEVSFGANSELAATAFAGADGLVKVSFAEGVKLAGGAEALKNTAFVKNCPVDFVMANNTLIYYKGNDEEVTVPLNVTEIGDSAFAGNKQLKKVNITKYVATVNDKAFAGCTKLATVTYARDGELTKVGADVFKDTPYFNNFDGDFFIVGKVLVKYLGEEAAVTIPNTVKTVADECFMGSYAAKTPNGYTWVVSSIFVPASVENIGEHSFALAQLDDGSYYIPALYAYNGTKTAELLTSSGLTIKTVPVIGDVDGDGEVLPADARLALRMAVKLDITTDPLRVQAADVNFDSDITPADARIILRLSVGLEDYTAEDLLFVPRTKLEILMAYNNALDTAVYHNAGYTKKITNTEAAHDMCPAALVNFYGDLSKKGYTNSTTTYAPKTQAAIDNLDMCTLVSDKNIASASCVFENGKYTINIKFKDTLDNKGTSDITKMFPVKTYNFFTDGYKGQKWWFGTLASNTLTKFDLTYTNPSLSAVITSDSAAFEEIKLSVGYHIAIDGRINGLAISSDMWKTGDATFDRLDVTTYSSFNYDPVIAK